MKYIIAILCMLSLLFTSIQALNCNALQVEGRIFDLTYLETLSFPLSAMAGEVNQPWNRYNYTWTICKNDAAGPGSAAAYINFNTRIGFYYFPVVPSLIKGDRLEGIQLPIQGGDGGRQGIVKIYCNPHAKFAENATVSPPVNNFAQPYIFTVEHVSACGALETTGPVLSRAIFPSFRDGGCSADRGVFENYRFGGKGVGICSGPSPTQPTSFIVTKCTQNEFSYVQYEDSHCMNPWRNTTYLFGYCYPTDTPHSMKYLGCSK